MDIRHERPMPNLEYKVNAPLQLELQSGEQVIVNQWSLAGIIYPTETDVLPKKAKLSIPFQGVDVRFDVAFTKGTGHYELNFKNLTGRQRETISIFYRSILSGKMASSNDMITALDTPVDLVPTGETDEEKTEGQKNIPPRLLRIIWNVGFYLLLACTVFGLIGGQIWNKLSSVDFDNGRIVAPLVSHVVTDAAYVDQVLVSVGTQVQRGDTLIRLSNPKYDGDLDDIRRDITIDHKRTIAARALYESHLSNELKSRQIFFDIYLAARAERQMDDFLGHYDLDQVLAAWEAVKKFDAGKVQTHGDFHDIRLKLRSALDDAKEAERRLKRDLSLAKSRARSADIVALSDGKISEIFVFQGEYVPRGKYAVTLEENRPRQVHAWVNEARADAVFVGMDADVRMRNSAGKHVHKGVVSNISAGIDPNTDNGFGMIVIIDLPEFNIEESRLNLRDQAPVKTRGLKKWRYPDWGL